MMLFCQSAVDDDSMYIADQINRHVDALRLHHVYQLARINEGINMRIFFYVNNSVYEW